MAERTEIILELYELVVEDKHEKLLSDEGIAFNCVVTVVEEVFMGPWNL